MTNAYDELYLAKAKASLAGMLDHAVRVLHEDPSSFFDLFISSGYAALFESGDIRTIAGMSGTELAYAVLEKSGLRSERITTRFDPYRSVSYLAGELLAQYQWRSSRSFAEIISLVPVAELTEACASAGTFTIEDFEALAQQRIDASAKETHLKQVRIRNGLSQRELSETSKVPLRTIQQYEQRQKNINKARAEYVIDLARALNCAPGDLLER